MNKNEVSEQTRAFVKVEMHQLGWVKELKDCVPLELLEWQLTEDFSPAILTAASRWRIHVIPKPRSKKDEYLVVGGFIYYLHLCASGWNQSIDCLIDPNIQQKDIMKCFLDDVQLSFLAIKGGVIPAAINAAILVSLSDCAANNNHHLGVQAPYRLLKKRDRVILNALTGFGVKSFHMASKDDVPESVLNVVSEILNLKKPEKKSNNFANDDIEPCSLKEETSDESA